MPKLLPTLTALLGVCSAVAAAQEAPPPAATEKAPAVQTPVGETPSAEIKPSPQKKEEKPKDPPVAHSTPKPAASKPALIPTPTPSPTAAPTATPKPRSFFQRLFGSRPRRATPAPATPTPTPALVRRNPRKPPVTPAPDGARPASAKPAPPLKPEKPATEKPAAVVKPGDAVAVAKPTKPTPATPPPIKKTGKPLIEPPADADPDVKEKYRFEQVKAKALDDPQVRSLKAKADDAATEEESGKALRAYNKALFEKMRKIDASLKGRIDQMETAILKRLNE